MDAAEDLPFLDHALGRAVDERQELVAAGAIDSGKPEDVHGKAAAAPELKPLRFGQKPLVAALGVGGERRLLGDESARMIAVDTGGGEIGDPLELARARSELICMLTQDGVAIGAGWRGDHHMGHALACAGWQGHAAIEHEGPITAGANLVCTIAAAARRGDAPALRGQPCSQHAC